jgi:RNA polymerase sigma-70 factor, ECF subfamily
MPPPSATDDAVLMQAVVGGSEAALRDIYDRHAGAMYSLARRVLDDEHRAEEVVQEVFLRLWTEPHRYDAGRGALRSFLYRETHSRSIERIRSEQARARREANDHRRDPMNVQHDDIEREVWAMIRSELVRDALAQLSDGERQAIELAYFGGHTHREVDTILSLPEGTVKSRIRLGLNKLSNALSDAGLGTTP